MAGEESYSGILALRILIKHKNIHSILFSQKITHTLAELKTMKYMEEIEMNIYDARMMLSDLLNIKGFDSKILKKQNAWLPGKYSRKEFYTVKPGFNEKDIELINRGLRVLSEFCRKHILKLPSECNDADIYGKYVNQQLKELRGVISLVHLREKYTKMAKNTFCYKMRQTPNRFGKPQRFTDADITSINAGINGMADIFSRLRLTL